jgi:hypothetical protein
LLDKFLPVVRNASICCKQKVGGFFLLNVCSKAHSRTLKNQKNGHLFERVVASAVCLTLSCPEYQKMENHVYKSEKNKNSRPCSGELRLKFALDRILAPRFSEQETQMSQHPVHDEPLVITKNPLYSDAFSFQIVLLWTRTLEKHWNVKFPTPNTMCLICIEKAYKSVVDDRTGYVSDDDLIALSGHTLEHV